jgi:hypothetical protein
LRDHERHVLERLVFAADEAERRRSHLVGAEALTGESLVVDGYNVLISLDCMLCNAPLFLCDDGVVRDIAARRGRYRPGPRSDEALKRLGQFLSACAVERATFIFDRQPSFSGEMAAHCSAALRRWGVQGAARTEERADWALHQAATTAILCSSDRVLIDGAPRVFDLVRALVGDSSLVARLPEDRLCPL